MEGRKGLKSIEREKTTRIDMHEPLIIRPLFRPLVRPLGKGVKMGVKLC